ncbi:hypothetical protein [Novosphingobium sp. HII-3]|uniref:hypothetical protein n=1 Tax=Novosphingobium sp. HII-3 TaxID=2075565 RepID=UPI0011AF4BF7|nr:hypothetical protein [Novosphingobium sp. HII-3]
MNETLSPLDRVRNWLAIFLVGSFVGALVVFVFIGIPETNKDIVTYMVGQLSGMTTMALGLYFTNKLGQETLDAKRSETTGKLADAVVSAAGDGKALREGDTVTLDKQP